MDGKQSQRRILTPDSKTPISNPATSESATKKGYHHSVLISLLRFHDIPRLDKISGAKIAFVKNFSPSGGSGLLALTDESRFRLP